MRGLGDAILCAREFVDGQYSSGLPGGAGGESIFLWDYSGRKNGESGPAEGGRHD